MPDRYRPLEPADAERCRGHFESLVQQGMVGCRDCDKELGGSRPIFDQKAHDEWHDEGCPDLIAMAS